VCLPFDSILYNLQKKNSNHKKTGKNKLKWRHSIATVIPYQEYYSKNTIFFTMKILSSKLFRQPVLYFSRNNDSFSIMGLGRIVSLKPWRTQHHERIILGGGLVVKVWNQNVCFFCCLRFKPCGCSYDGHWRLTWSLTSGPMGLVEVRASWPGQPH